MQEDTVLKSHHHMADKMSSNSSSSPSNVSRATAGSSRSGGSSSRKKRGLSSETHSQSALDEQQQEQQQQQQDDEEDEEEETFKVRDLLNWTDGSRANKGKNPFDDDGVEDRPGYNMYEIDMVTVFYLFCVFMCLAVAEITMKPYLERVFGEMIINLQERYGDQYVWYFDDLLSFPTSLWGLLPGIGLIAVRSWRSVGMRMILLQGLGSLFKWFLNLVFRQGRPFWVNHRIQMWHCPTVYGFPSGHALNLLLVVAPIVERFWYNYTDFTMTSIFAARRRRTGNCNRFVAFVASFVVMGLYMACMFGRLYIGTHFGHDILMGIVCAMLLLQIFNRRNVSIIADRIMISAAEDWDHTHLTIRVVGIILRGCGIALFLVFFICLHYFVCTHLFDADPPEWTERALKFCPNAPDTREGSLFTPFRAAGIIVGWFVGLSLWAVDPKVPNVLNEGDDEDDPEGALSRKRRREKQPLATQKGMPSSVGRIKEEQNAITYGTILHSEEEFRVAWNQGEYPWLEAYGVNLWLTIVSMGLILFITYALAFYIPDDFIGFCLAIVFATYVFPRFFQPKLKRFSPLR